MAAVLVAANDAEGRAARGECRFCSRRAEHRTPVIRHARPLGDAVLRRLGLVPQIRFQLEIPLDLDAAVELCELHRHRAASLLGAEIADAAADQAKFTDALTRRLISFQLTELHAKMDADTAADAKKKRGARSAASGAPVVDLATRRSGGTL